MSRDIISSRGTGTGEEGRGGEVPLHYAVFRFVFVVPFITVAVHDIGFTS